MADWDLKTLILRRIDLHLAGANWQRGGGKGQRPKPIPLPDDKGRGGQPAASKPSGPEIAQRLRNLGLIPAGDPEPAQPSADEMAADADAMWLARHQRLADED